MGDTTRKVANRRPPGDPNKGKPLTELARTRISKEKRRTFLNHLAATCNVRKAAAAAGTGASYFYNLRRVDATFEAGWDAALQAGYDRLEEALLARALEQVADDQFDVDAVTVELVDGAAAAKADHPAPVDAAAAESGGGRDQASGSGLSQKLTRVDAQLALAMLNRRAAAERKGRERHGRRRPTATEVEKALNAKLDRLARRVTPLGGSEG